MIEYNSNSNNNIVVVIEVNGTDPFAAGSRCDSCCVTGKACNVSPLVPPVNGGGGGGGGTAN